jgi:hypothetical protein
MRQILHSLSNDISILKSELYFALDSNKSLNNRDVYLLSVKLDKLIYEYESYAQRGYTLKRKRY